MPQKFTYYPLGNAQTMQLELDNKKRMLIDFANVKSDNTDKRWNLSDDVRFEITMEWQKSSAPEPMVFTIDSNGLTLKTSSSAGYSSSPAPRAS